MSASGPHRQRSLKDRIHQGISSLAWQAKPTSKSTATFTSYSDSPSNATKPFILGGSSKTSLSLDTHGYVNPLDWEVPSYNSELKLGVNQILAVQKDKSPESILAAGQEKDKSSQEAKVGTERKMVTRSITQPEGTIPFTVSATDTLAGIAARFYTTPSELAKINKLSSRLIFPGQTLYVPIKDVSVDDSSRCVTPPSTPIDKADASPLSPTQKGTFSGQPASKPGHVERVLSTESKKSERSHSLSPTLSQEEEERRLDEECHKKFLKLNVKHITDGLGVVPGVLLITPNALMFDPNVSDILVLEHGSEKYSVTCPMNMVANAAMYRDIAHMKLKNMPPASNLKQDSNEVYHSENCPKYKSKQSVDDNSSSAAPNEENVSAETCACSQEDSAIAKEICDDKDGSKENWLSKTEDSFADQGTVVSQNLMDLSCSMDTEDCKAEDTVKESVDKPKPQLTNPMSSIKKPIPDPIVTPKSGSPKIDSPKVGSPKIDSPKVGSPKIDSPKVGSPKVGSPKISALSHESDCSDKQSKSGWYSQLSEISHLPSQIDFSRFKSNKSDNSDSLLSTSCSDSIDNSSSDSHKTRLLKRLSQPVSWIESFASGSVDSAVEITASAQSTLSKILPQAFSSDKEDTPPVSANLHNTRHFSSSPHSFVDFSSGLFAQDSTENIRDISELSTGRSKFYVQLNTGTSGEKSFNDFGDSIDSAHSANREFKEENVEKSPRKSIQIKNMVDENPDLFKSIDKLIPKPAVSCDDPPLYLCLLMGHPTKQTGPDAQLHSPLHRTAVMSYGQKCIHPEYWFSIPKDKVDELYAFFNMWAPGVYGDPSTINFDERGYRLIETDEEISEEETDGKSKQESDSQVVTIDELTSTWSIDGELPLPEMCGQSGIIDDTHRRKIADHLPARAEGYPWSLLYSNIEHGFSLKTLYREMGKYECPALLIISDSNSAIFGAMVTCSLKISEHFYGNGESFLFTFNPEFKCYNWTGENNYFIKGASDSLSFGAGDGFFGLWLDEDLYKGRSHKCLTYGNEVLSSSEDFVINGIEVWGFM